MNFEWVLWDWVIKYIQCGVVTLLFFKTRLKKAVLRIYVKMHIQTAGWKFDMDDFKEFILKCHLRSIYSTHILCTSDRGTCYFSLVIIIKSSFSTQTHFSLICSIAMVQNVWFLIKVLFGILDWENDNFATVKYNSAFKNLEYVDVNWLLKISGVLLKFLTKN